MFDPLNEYFDGLVVRSFEEFTRYFMKPHDEFCVICRYQYSSLETVSLAYELTAKAVWEIGDCLLVLEEAEQFLDSQNRESFLNYLISFGRHRKISLIGIGRRPVELAIRLRAAFTSIVSFKQTEPNDIRYLEALGFNAEEVTSLELYEYAVKGEPIDSKTEEAKQTPGEPEGA